MRNFIKYLYYLIDSVNKKELDLNKIQKELQKLEGETQIIAICATDSYLLSKKLITYKDLLEIKFLQTQKGGEILEELSKKKSNENYFNIIESLYKEPKDPIISIPVLLLNRQNYSIFFNLFFIIILFFIFLVFRFGLIFFLNQKLVDYLEEAFRVLE